MIEKKIKYKLLSETAAAPTRARSSDTGWDLTTSRVEEIQVPVIKDGVSSFVTALKLHTDIVIQPPEGYYFDMRCRSGFSKCGWILGNGLGTIDQDYRGEWMAIIHPTHQGLVRPVVGDKHFQLVLQKYENAGVVLEEVNNFEETDRGDKGFGSSGR